MKSSSSRPNILLIIVDQFRFPRFSYGDEGGLLPPLKDILGFQGETDDANPLREFFPGLWSMRRNAVVLRNHSIASSACIPSRAALLTGQYGTRTGCSQTDGLFKDGDSAAFPWLSADGIPTLGHWFRAAGYRTHYVGKWHVSNPHEHSLERFGFGAGSCHGPSRTGPASITSASSATSASRTSSAGSCAVILVSREATTVGSSTVAAGAGRARDGSSSARTSRANHRSPSERARGVRRRLGCAHRAC